MTEEELRELESLAEDWRGTSGEVQLGDAVRRLVAEVRRLKRKPSSVDTFIKNKSLRMKMLGIKHITLAKPESAP